MKTSSFGIAKAVSMIIPAVLAALSSAACSSEVPRAEAEAQEKTSEAIVSSCPAGYSPVCDCQPEYICSGVPLHCTIKTVCSCDCVQNPPFPIPFPAMPTSGGALVPKLQLVTVTFAGDQQWNGSQWMTTTSLADHFGDFVVASQWLQTVTADYRPNPTTTPFAAKHLARVQLPTYTGGAINDIPGFIVQNITAGVFPFPSADPKGVFYEIYMPAAACATASIPGSSFHGSFTYNGALVTFARICGNAVFMPGNTAPSHEIAEAITNPNEIGRASCRERV